MKRFALYIGLATAIVASCSIQEEEFKIPQQDDVIYYASFEQPAEDGTRVYANEDLLLRWTADDRVSIFGKNTYNQQYKFLGETGDNSGGFSKVDGAEYVTGNPISHTVSVYPYQASTKISESEVLNVTLPAEQSYAENTFGIGANTMVSVSSDNVLQYKNLGGYLMLKLYGEGISVSSITLKGNNGEKLAGKASVTMHEEGLPTVEMMPDATTEITLSGKNAVVLGSSAEDATTFWFVLPPLAFDDGFTIIVRRKDGTVFTKSTTKAITITRNCITKMSPFQVEMEGTQPGNIIYYTSIDGNIVEPYQIDGLVSNKYEDGIGVMTFSKNLETIEEYAFYECQNIASISIPMGVTSIGDYAFYCCFDLTSISIPDSVTSIGNSAFFECSFLSSITIPDSVTCIGNSAFFDCQSLPFFDMPKGVKSIGESAFEHCLGLTSIEIPDGVTHIGDHAFRSCIALTTITIPKSVARISNGLIMGCSNLTSISLPDGVTSIGNYAFCDCSSLTSIVIPDGVTSIGNYAFSGCSSLTSVVIPDGVTSISDNAFMNCSSLSSIELPESLTYIGGFSFQHCSSLSSIVIPESVTVVSGYAFYECSSLEWIEVLPQTPPMSGPMMFNRTGLCPIYIPSGSEDAYVNAENWKRYALRMKVKGSDMPVAYLSSDYSQDGKVQLLQKAEVGRGVNIVFMGDGFLDKDMGPGGKYEQKMSEAMEQFFAYEPFFSFRNRFNVYAVKVVSSTDIYNGGNCERGLTYEQDDCIYFRTLKSKEYGAEVPNPYNQPLIICTVCNTDEYIDRSFCAMSLEDNSTTCIIYDAIGTVLNHELGGHGFGLLLDEYVERTDTFSDIVELDNLHKQGWGANVDWRSDPSEVRWRHLLSDSRYRFEGLGVYEGGYLYSHGIYRATENSMMRFNDTPFNAPSREQIYKFIMQYSEGDNWVYNYEEFVKADERGRMEAAEELGPWNSPRRNAKMQTREEFHCPPITIDKTVKAVGMDKDGHVIIVK